MKESSEPRCIGHARDYAELHEILRARKNELDFSCATGDEISGLTPGYFSKILSPRPLKVLGKISLGLVLATLGVKLAVVEDPEALARIAPRLVKREIQIGERAYRWTKAGTITVSKRWVRRIARAGGLARAAKLTPEQRSASARRAAKARKRALTKEQRIESARRAAAARWGHARRRSRRRVESRSLDHSSSQFES